jgi:hypothetical protein
MGKASRTKREPSAPSHARYVNQCFEGRDVELDGGHFERCVFRNCKLLYRGGTLPNLIGNDVSGCNFKLEGAAKQTILFCRMLGAMGLHHIVDALTQEMRQPLPPEKNRSLQ